MQLWLFLVAPYNFTTLWIGGNDFAQEMVFVWENEYVVDEQNYTNWMTGEPNNINGGEQCMDMVLFNQDEPGTWTIHVNRIITSSRCCCPGIPNQR